MIKIFPRSLQKEKNKFYSVILKENLQNDLIHFLKKFKQQFCFEKIVIATDHYVKKTVGIKLQKNLSSHFKEEIVLISVKPGEKSKSTEGKYLIETEMLINHCNRKTVLIALGGGVIGDLAGFTAATYMRGIPYIQMPTTLLSMVDSSVGGKTGINHALGKNLIGAFHQPKAVFADMKMLETLSQEQFINGFVEALKIFLTYDKKYFELCVKNLPTLLSREKNAFKLLQKIILRAIQLKAQVVGRDENESGERAVLNFGHTMGHAIEKVFNYKILHGIAVGLGILIETKISEKMGFLKPDKTLVIKKTINQLNISMNSLKLSSRKIDALIKATASDKKNKQGQVFYVLLKEIGKIAKHQKQFTHAVSNQLVKTVLQSMMSSEG